MKYWLSLLSKWLLGEKRTYRNKSEEFCLTTSVLTIASLQLMSLFSVSWEEK